ncbi:hypothetical protein ES319_D01G256600v1 [Gossypium barbadense]|uniref:Uncharacterized protein n=1 Tax=Gossypium barbadense TaxID=3634 RepID=A0A5J5SYL8_GOSBA|nr:hypothetical protein ES319_D01G256600v1 [Gossypium barbadense]
MLCSKEWSVKKVLGLEIYFNGVDSFQKQRLEL